MVRLLKQSTVVTVLLVAGLQASADEPPLQSLSVGADISYIDVSGYPAWTQGSAGKLRYDSSNDSLTLSRAFIDYERRLADTVNGKVVALLYDDGVGSLVDLSEAYIEWRPLTMTSNRYRLKVGAFYPRLSLENSDAGWSSPYTISSSAINTWIGEEFRLFGAEASVTRRPQSLGGAQTFSLYGAVFYNNDPAGTLLSWKGWSIHDRQTRFGDKLPLPPVPQIQPGMYFELQDPFVAPFREIDNRAGYYVGGEWAMNNRFLMRAMHYDNRADPEAYEDGQFGWRTDFNHVGLQATLPGDVGLISQWMEGSTVWGIVIDGVRAVDADFYSEFILLTKAFSRHRVSLRYDRFEVTDNDNVPMDDNAEYGDAWTVAYQFYASQYVTLAAEWMQIETYRDAWEYYGLEDENVEKQLQLSVQLRFGTEH